MGEEKKLNIRIGQVKDVNNRQVFSNHVLCAQFLRDYADLDILKNVQPEDIEDVTDIRAFPSSSVVMATMSPS